MRGEYVTGVVSEVAQLDAEVEQGHPTIYRDPDDMTVDTEALSPMEVIRLQAREEALKQVRAEMAAATNPTNDRGSSDQGNVADSFANTANISEGASGSTSVDASTPASGAPTLLSSLKSKASGSK